MNDQLIHSMGKASAAQIVKHLTICDEAFIPPLSNRVNLKTYAEKIVANATTFEAWKNADLAGLIAAYENKESGFTFITNVSVLPDFMGHGIAAQLLASCVKYSLEREIKSIKLEVNNENIAAIKFYRKHGFTEAGKKEDMLMMNLVL